MGLHEIDEKIERIHKAGKTSFPIFNPLHNWLRMKSKAYYAWHLNRYFERIHWGIFTTVSLATFFKVIVALGFSNFFFPGHALAVSYTWDGGGSTNNWSEAANWSSDIVPVSTDAAVFDSTSTKDAIIDASFQGTITGLTISSGYTGTITASRSLTINGSYSQADGSFNGGSSTITITGDFTNSANFTSTSGSLVLSNPHWVTNTFTNSGTFTHNSGTVNFTGQGNVTITTGGDTFYNFTLSKSYPSGGTSVVTTFVDSFTVANNFNDNNVNNVCGGCGAPTVANPASAITITVQGNVTKTIGTSGNAQSFGGTNLTIDMTGSGKTFTLSGGTFASNLKLSGSTTTITQTGGSLSGGTVTIAGTSHTATAHSTTATFNPTNLTINSGNTLDMAAENLTVATNLTNSGTLTGTSGTWILSSGGTSGITTTSGTLTFPNTNVSIRGRFTNSGTINAGTGTVTFYNGTLQPTAQQITTGGATFYNVALTNISNSCYNKTLTDSFTVANDLTDSVNSGGSCGLSNPSSAVTITVQGNFTKNGTDTFGGTNLTVEMTGTAKIFSTSGGTYAAHLKLSGTTTTITQTGGSFSGGTVTVAGTNHTVTLGSSTTTFSPASLTINSSNTLLTNNKTVSAGPFNNSGTITAGGSESWTFSTFTNSGTINATAGNLSISGSLTNTGTFNHNNGTVLLTGTNAGTASIATGGATFYNFTFQKTYTAAVSDTTLTDSFTVANTLTDNNLNSACGGCNSPVVNNPSSPITITVQGNFVKTNTALHAQTFGGANLTIDMTGTGKSFTISKGAFASNLTLSGSNTTITQSGTGTFSTGTTTVSGTNHTVTVGSGTTTYAPGRLVINSGNTLYTNAKNLTSSTTYSNNGTLKVNGSETLTLTMDTDSGTTLYVGDGDSAADTYTLKETGTTDFYHLTISSTDSNDTFNSAATKTVAGNFELTNGLVTATVGSWDFNGNYSQSGGTFTAPSTTSLAGNFARTGGTFTHNSGTLTLDGTNQTVSGSTTFNNLSKATSSATTLTLGAGDTQTVVGTLTLTGTSGNLLSLRSTVPGTRSRIDPQGSRTINYVNTQDNHNISSTFINPASWTDSGNNIGWGTPPTISTLGPTALVNGSTGNDSTPGAFTFTTGDADSGDTVQFQIQIDDSADFGSLIIDYTSALTTPGSMSFTVGQAAGSGTYATGSASTILSDTSYYWRAKAIDNHTNSSSFSTANSGSVAFIVDTTAPIFSLITTTSNNGIANSRAKVGDIVTTTFTLTEAAPALTATLASSKGMDCSNPQNYDWVCTRTLLGTEVEGSNTISLSATDAVGNTRLASSSITTDFTTPAFAYFNLSSNNSLSSLRAKSGDIVTATFTSLESLNANPTVSLGGKNMTLSSVASNTYTYTRTLDGSETEESANLNISGIDTTGNTGVDTSQSFTTDFSNPTITITTPTTDETYATEQSPLASSGTASDTQGISEVTYSLNGGASTVATGTNSWNIATLTLNEGTNTLAVTATDLSGNTASDTLTITKTTAPSPTPSPSSSPTPTTSPTSSTTPTPTAVATPTPTPAIVEITGLQAYVSQTAITLSFDPLPEGYAAKIYRSESLDGPQVELSSQLTTNTYVDSTATPNIKYIYSVVAFSLSNGKTTRPATTEGQLILINHLSVRISTLSQNPPPFPETITVAPKSTRQLYAHVYDEQGTPVTNASVTWSLTNPNSGSINQKGVLTGGEVGDYISGIKAVASLNNREGNSEADLFVDDSTDEVASVRIDPLSITLKPGAQHHFKLFILNQNGTLLDPALFTTTWSARGGTITQTGLYTAGATQDTFEPAVTATISREGQSWVVGARVTISSEVPYLSYALMTSYLQLLPSSTGIYSAYGYDQFSNLLPGVTKKFSNNLPEAGVIDSSGILHTSTKEGCFGWIIRADLSKDGRTAYALGALTVLTYTQEQITARDEATTITLLGTPLTFTLAPDQTHTYTANVTNGWGKAKPHTVASFNRTEVGSINAQGQLKVEKDTKAGVYPFGLSVSATDTKKKKKIKDASWPLVIATPNTTTPTADIPHHAALRSVTTRPGEPSYTSLGITNSYGLTYLGWRRASYDLSAGGTILPSGLIETGQTEGVFKDSISASAITAYGALSPITPATLTVKADASCWWLLPCAKGTEGEFPEVPPIDPGFPPDGIPDGQVPAEPGSEIEQTIIDARANPGVTYYPFESTGLVATVQVLGDSVSKIGLVGGVLGGLLAPLILGVASALSGGMNLAQAIRYSFVWRLPRRRRKYWGYVKAKDSNLPIVGASLGLIPHALGQAFDRSVSDLTGGFSFLPPKNGSYIIAANAKGYYSYTTTTEDMSPQNLPRDEKIYMEPQTKAQTTGEIAHRLHTISRVSHFIEGASTLLFFLGLSLTLYELTREFTWLLTGILLAYLLILINWLYTHLQPTLDGTVLLTNGTPISPVVIKIFRVHTTTEQITALTNRKNGYFRLKLKPGRYILAIQADGFEPYKSQEITVQFGKSISISPVLEKISFLPPS